MYGEVVLAERAATVLLETDVVVVGASLRGVAAAAALAGSGRRVCLIEAGPTAGTEVTRWWDLSLSGAAIPAAARAAAVSWGQPAGGPPDPVLSALAFDRVIEDAGVCVFFCVRPGRVLTDADGRLCGVEVVGKSGRQVIRATAVLDATCGAVFVRAVTGRPAPVPARVIRRAYVAGVCPEGLPVAPVRMRTESGSESTLRADPAAWPGEAVVSVTLPGGAAGESYGAAVDAVIRLRGSQPGWERAILVDVSPEAEIDPGPDSVSFPELEGTGVAVAGDDSAAWQSVLPPEPRRSLPVRRCGGTRLETSECVAAPEHDLCAAILPDAPAILHEAVDVLVAGYGTGGVFAAMAAAEEGVRTAVVDPSPVVGGIGTAGRIHSYYHGLRGGLQDRIDERAAGRVPGGAATVRGFHPCAKADILERGLRETGVAVHAGHALFGVIREGRRITGAVTVAADGYHVIPCAVIIDATGDGDVLAASGAPFTLGREGDGFPQPYSYTPTLVRDGVLHHHNFDAGWVDPTDTSEVTRALLEGRSRIRIRAPFTAERHYCTLAATLGIRESRFAVGRCVLTFDDFMQGRHFPDAVCSAHAHHDNHAMDYAEESEWSRRHVALFGLWRFLLHGEVPYRALLPQGVDNLLMACRALSVDHDLHQLLRMQRDVQVIGEICGVAAAVAVRDGIPPALLDPAVPGRRLRERGIRVEPGRAVCPGGPDDLLAKLATPESGLAMWRLSLLRGDEAPDWEQIVRNESDPDLRFREAVVAALAGLAGEGCLQVLRETVRQREDEPRLGVKSPPRAIVALLALAEAGDPGTAALTGELLLEEGHAGPDLLLLLKAMEKTGDPAGIGSIRSFLARTEGDGFAVPLWGVRTEDGDPTSFRFAVEIRAVRTLFSLGDREEAERLRAYVRDRSLLVRRLARNVAANEGHELLRELLATGE